MFSKVENSILLVINNLLAKWKFSFCSMTFNNQPRLYLKRANFFRIIIRLIIIDLG